MASNNDNGGQKRKTLTLNLDNTSKFSGGSARKGPFEVEIKKKRTGLILDKGKRPPRANPRDRSVNDKVGDLTQSEIRARLNVLKSMRAESEKTRTERPRREPVEPKAPRAAVPEAKRDAVPVRGPDVAQQRRRPAAQTQMPRKKETFVPSSGPVVFRASEYAPRRPNVGPVRQDASGTGGRSSVPERQRPLSEAARRPSVVPPRPRPIDPSLAQPMKQDTQSQKKSAKPRDAESVDKKRTYVAKPGSNERRSKSNGKMSRAFLDMALNDESDVRSRSMASIKRARQKQRSSDADKEQSKVVRDVDIPDTITVGELANRMAVRSAEVIKFLMSSGTMVTINQTIDGDTAEIVCTEFGHVPHRITDVLTEFDVHNIKDDPKDLEPRAPVVAVMGHVDHGKTTLLDTLRKTSVAQREAGGITQHVAAYQIETESGKRITFIDTPGHAAFSNIRARGACITDIIVLVVAADDGIKDQTIEVIKQAKSQNVPLVVAINKIDKPGVNIDRIKTDLMNHEVVLECFGGDVLSSEISAKQNINIDGLIETILLQAEVLELRANKKRSAVGTVLESRVDKGKGIIASVIVQHGTLKPGDVIVAGKAPGKVRTIYNDSGDKIKEAGPAMPIEISGFDKTPEPGDVLMVVESEQKAREIAEKREALAKAKEMKAKTQSIEQMISKDDGKVLNVIIKADVHGSLEAIVATLEAIQHPEISVKVVDKGVGIISENDVDFAKTARAIVVGFNVNVSIDARDAAKQSGVKILKHSIIYHMTEEIKAIMGTMLSPIIEENYIGTADVRKIFTISRVGTIAGCYVTEGIIKRNDSKIKVVRNKKVIFEGKIKSMRHEKDEIKESRQGHECGIFAEGYNDFAVGDQIECYEIVTKSRTVD